jgi:O-antigen/teichoic acid export membrane protein
VRSGPDDETPAAPAPEGRYRRQLLRNTVAAGAANGWTIVLVLASVPLLVRGLGTAAFGLWAILQTFSAVTGWLSLADLGVGVATTRAVAACRAVDDVDGARRAAVTGVAVAGAIAVVGAVVLAVVGVAAFPALFDVPDHLVDGFRVAIVLFSVQVVFELVGALLGAGLDGLQRIDLARAVDSSRRTVVVGAAAVAALVSGELAVTVLASAATTVVAVIASAVVAAHAHGGLRLRPDRVVARDLLHDGRRVWLLNSTGVLHRTMDRLIVGILLGPSAVALVEIATQVQNGIAAVLSATSYAVTSSAAWVRARVDEARVTELLLRATKYACLATLPLCATVALLAPALMEVWVGSRYDDAAGLVALGAAYLATQAPLAAGSNLLVGVGRASAVTRPAVLSLVVNAGASLALVPRYGIAGAFVGTIISSLVLTPLLLRAVAAETSVPPSRLIREGVGPAVLPTVAAAAGAAAGVVVGPGAWADLLLGGAAAGLAWLAATALVALGADERRELARVLPGR